MVSHQCLSYAAMLHVHLALPDLLSLRLAKRLLEIPKGISVFSRIETIFREQPHLFCRLYCIHPLVYA